MSKQQSGAKAVGEPAGESVRMRDPSSEAARNGTNPGAGKPGSKTETSVDDAPASPFPGFGGLSIDFSADTTVGAPTAPAPLPEIAYDSPSVMTVPGGP